MGKSRVLFCLVAAVVAVSAASARGSAPPGVTSKQILIGGTTPLSGPASAYSAVAKGADAYFKYVNDHGGVFGRKIKYKYLDDAYDPSRAARRHGAATSRSTRGRSATSRTTSPRGRSTAATSSAPSARPRSASSTKTTTTARTCS